MEEKFRLTEEEITFSPNQMDRINQLRKERNEENEKNKTRKTIDFRLKKGDPVYVDLNGTRFTGKIEKVNGTNVWDVSYDVSSPYGILKDLDYRQVTKRNLQDLSNVEIPEELKNLPANKLVKMLRSTYGVYREYGDAGAGHVWFNGKSYSDVQIKAALIGKPHVSNKRERLRVKEHKKKNS